MGIDNWTKSPPGAPANHTGFIEEALKLAESGNYDGVLNSAFTTALQAVRGQEESFYLLKVKPRIKALKAAPITLLDLDKLTRPPKHRYNQQNDGDEGEKRQTKADLVIELVRRWAEVFSDPAGKPYVSFDVEPINPDTGEIMPHIGKRGP